LTPPQWTRREGSESLPESVLVSFFFPLLLAAAAAGAPVNPSEELSGAHECALYTDYHPCSFTALPGGDYAVRQVGRESFEGTLTPKGSLFHLDGSYRFVDGTEIHLVGDISRSASSIGGRVKIGSTPHTVDIRPAKLGNVDTASAPAALLAILARMTTLQAVAAGTKLPLFVKVVDAPTLSFTAKRLDERIWNERLRGIFGMVPTENNIRIECKDAKLRCKLTAQSGADIFFYFSATPKGPKLKSIELPSQGD
jgi:hypothetical protein